MYALLLTSLMSVSIDCPAVIQFAIEMEIKYTNTDYFIQYEKDCCLGVGVICENERVTELHWGFAKDYTIARYPEVHVPPNLRVLDLGMSTKSILITKLPDSLKVLDLTSTSSVSRVKFNLDAFPNLSYFVLGLYSRDYIPKLPLLPDSLEYIDLYGYPYDIYPKNAISLKKLYNDGFNSDIAGPLIPFPNVPDTIEVVFTPLSNLYGLIPMSFKSIEILELSYWNMLTENLTITSPNITYLGIKGNNIDNLFVSNPQKLNHCDLSYNYFDISNANDLMTLQPYGCSYSLKSPPSIDCPNFIEFLRQLNMHLTDPYRFNNLVNRDNCCDRYPNIISCNSNRITYIHFQEAKLNGTINATLLPDTLDTLELYSNDLKGSFPDLSHLSNLKNVDLSSNQLEGSIFGKLPPNILNLNLFYNKLNGTIPNILSLRKLNLFNNEFNAVENELQGNQLNSVDLDNNLIRGTIDMTNFAPGSFSFYFRNNFIDKIIAKPGTTATYCDVENNLIPQNDLANFTNCLTQYQKYNIATQFDSCKYVYRMFHKFGLNNFSDKEFNCCEYTYEYVTCVNQQVTELRFSYHEVLTTYNGFAFDLQDIPPTLQSLTILSKFNQTAIIPPNIPSHIKYLNLQTNLIGKMPTFSEGIQTLILSQLDLNGEITPFPSTLKIINIMYCNLQGILPTLPPNLTEIQIQGNQLVGPLPIFPNTSQIVVLGDNGNEGNDFYDHLWLQNPKTLILGNTNIYEVEIQNTTQLSNCDMSFSPLLNSTFISNYTMCKKYYLSPKIEKLQVTTTTTPSMSTLASISTIASDLRTSDAFPVSSESNLSSTTQISIPVTNTTSTASNSISISTFDVSEVSIDPHSGIIHSFSENTHFLQNDKFSHFGQISLVYDCWK
eukprot:NODE_640_length_5117_cov_0.610203.p1 type:complete len:889 gc:universal NODE_640_length_5117_cov_0.610203:5090-2424(-)